MLRTLKDAANLTTIAGMLLSIGALIFAMQSKTEYCLALLLGAVTLDHLDGLVARLSVGRDQFVARVGADLDSLIDLVHGSIVPSVLVLAVARFSLVAIVASTMLMCAAALRLAFYNNTGLSSDGRFTGVPVTWNAPVLSVVYVLYRDTVGHAGVAMLLCTVMAGLAIGHVSSLTPPSIRSAKQILAFGCSAVILSVLLIRGAG
jgi:CDP-diacylglycerol--serine O-phosphatidyltransferase